MGRSIFPVEKKLFTIDNPFNKSIIDHQVPSWSTTLKICLGAMFT